MITKPQLLAMLRYAYNKGNYDAVTTGYDIEPFIKEVERTNRVGNFELPQVMSWKFSGINQKEL